MRVRQVLVAFLEPQFQQRLADCAAGILKTSWHVNETQGLLDVEITVVDDVTFTAPAVLRNYMT